MVSEDLLLALGTPREQAMAQIATKLYHRQRVDLHTEVDDILFHKEVSELNASLGQDSTPMELFHAFLMSECSVNGASIPCEDSDRNAVFIDRILNDLDQVKVIWMLRDPWNGLLSKKNKWKRNRLSLKDKNETFDSRRLRPRREIWRSFFN